MPSPAFTLFNGRRRQEICELVNIFEQRNAKPGPNTDYALLNSAVLLLVASWEVYCEDTALAGTKKLLRARNVRFEDLPNKARAKFIQAVKAMDSEEKNVLNSPIGQITGEGWRDLYWQEVENFAQSVNTPRFKGKKTRHDIDGLFEWLIGRAISPLLDEQAGGEISKKIDDAITLRGSIAHRGRPASGNLKAGEVRKLASMFCAAAAHIEDLTKQQVWSNCKVLVWQTTHPVKTAIEGWM